MITSVILATVFAGAPAASAGNAPAWVAEAVSWGANQKRVEPPSAKGSYSIRYSTPYLRVAMAAQEAKRQGRNLDPANVPHELTAPELRLFVQMLPMVSSDRLIGMAAATSVTLVVAGEHLKPSAVDTVVKPMSAAAAGAEMRPFEGRELRASFPLSQPIPAELEAMVEYSWVENKNIKHVERTYKLDLKKVKW